MAAKYFCSRCDRYYREDSGHEMRGCPEEIQTTRNCINKSCKESNPQTLENFYPRKNRPGKFYERCKSCWKENRQTPKRKAYTKEYNKKYNQRLDIKRLKRNDNLKQKFNITLEEYEKMFTEQNGNCYICNTHQSLLQRGLSVDHCHRTGKIRSLLCDHCNKGLGFFKENIDLLKKVINYLEKYGN